MRIGVEKGTNWLALRIGQFGIMVSYEAIVGLEWATKVVAARKVHSPTTTKHITLWSRSLAGQPQEIREITDEDVECWAADLAKWLVEWRQRKAARAMETAEKALAGIDSSSRRTTQ